TRAVLVEEDGSSRQITTGTEQTPVQDVDAPPVAIPAHMAQPQNPATPPPSREVADPVTPPQGETEVPVVDPGLPEVDPGDDVDPGDGTDPGDPGDVGGPGGPGGPG